MGAAGRAVISALAAQDCIEIAPRLLLETIRRRAVRALIITDAREVLLLRLEQELTLEEIGEITGVGRETVKSRLRYAMDRLRTRLNE